MAAIVLTVIFAILATVIFGYIGVFLLFALIDGIKRER